MTIKYFRHILFFFLFAPFALCIGQDSIYNANMVGSGMEKFEVKPIAGDIIFDEVVFYDLYAETVDEPVPEGIIRIDNTAYAKKLDLESLSIGEKLTINLRIGARCDNYDRIGGLFMDLVPKGEEFISANVKQRLEIGRFITPFMNKNKEPKEVPYSFEVNNLAAILNDPAMQKKYDFYLKFYLGGVPYAANKEVEGCEGRNDVFEGTVALETSGSVSSAHNQYILSISDNFQFNDYQEGASDEIGESYKTFKFKTDKDIRNASLHVIISNHGAQSQGEEYIRRKHYLYFDEQLIAEYTPGGKSCEPFRVYNTQRNGIYGREPRTNWNKWSNWCPGNTIPIRTYDLGMVEAGDHSFRLKVPEAIFANDDGNFPVSVYLQGASI
ncbi:peptide-N-glycosidase F-related protein [Autumnicola musiva]|uniref:Peptide-N-glycosidase F-related protein n=1 Tax=Autumnicola musiva TaxID=3075589 RepID=A0ABU3D9I1_9FLAO|nr:peptide-N-glycosidase F-related protein [Zunongwangia sp. F117]MDT0678111.1 peptide-N-glycosidase F-related protein [Zunongwangia sp. F117]